MYIILSCALVLLVVIEVAVLVEGQGNEKYEYTVRTNRNKQQYVGSPDLITFPDDILLNDDDKTKGKMVEENAINQIPIDLIDKINEMQNITQFLDEFVAMDTVNPQDAVYNRFQNEEKVERANGLNPKPANCIPQMTVVPLIPEGYNDPSLIFFPSCTRVMRCGGCCSHKLLSCQPIETETKNFQMVVSQYVGGGSKLIYKEKVPVFVEVHTKCRCDCTIKASDCTKYQIYNKPLCRCECTNHTDFEKCQALGNSIKSWDPVNCVCRCREEKDCTTGTAWDGNTCSCVEEPLKPRRNTPIEDRSRFILKPT